jgi:hypothetical protein
MNEDNRRCPHPNKVNTPGYSHYFDKNGSIGNFVKLLKERGFVVQKGRLSFIDLLKLASEGIIDTTFGNNTGVPYAAYLLPPAPNQEPSLGQRPLKGYDHKGPYNYPPNVDYVAPGVFYKLRPDEAIVLIGQTPPPATYFSFRSYVGFVQNKPAKDYSDNVTAGNRDTGFYHFIGASMGDQISNNSIRTDSTPYGTPGNPFDSSTVIITTADMGINEQMRDALAESGFNPGIMNNDYIPMDLVNMGLERGKDTFMFAMRVANFENHDIGWDYIYNLDKYFTVLRITPEKPYPATRPWPIPRLKIKETCTTEFQVVPTARNGINYLRNQIIRKYGNPEYDIVDMDFKLWILDNYAGILQDVNVLIDNRDAVYLRTESFELASDDDFVILYGINHTQTGFATYFNTSFYGEELDNGVVGAIVTNELQYPADDYFPGGYKNGKYYYVIKMARKPKEGNEVIIPYSTGNPEGSAYGVDNNEEAYIGFRIYVNQETKVAPALFDIIWGQAILFTKKGKKDGKM